jgi:hypothetical protein
VGRWRATSGGVALRAFEYAPLVQEFGLPFPSFFLASASTTFGDRDDEAIAGRVLRLTNAPLVEWCAEALEKTLHVFVVRGPFGARSVLARGHRG